MKTFKNLKSIVITLMAAFTVCLMMTSLTACGSDDDNKGSSPGYTYNDIKGSWKWTSSYDRKGDNIQEDFFVGQHLYIISATDFESTTKEVGDVTYVLNGDKFVKKTQIIEQ